MADGRRKDLWQHTSSIICMLYNINIDTSKHPPSKPSDFNPYTEKPKQDPAPLAAPFSVLRAYALNK